MNGLNVSKIIRRLKALNIPFILPALILYRLFKKSKIDYKAALWALQQISEFISEDEFSITIRDASDLLKLNLSETVDLLAEIGIKGNIRASDVYASLMTFAPLD